MISSILRGKSNSLSRGADAGQPPAVGRKGERERAHASECEGESERAREREREGRGERRGAGPQLVTLSSPRAVITLARRS